MVAKLLALAANLSLCYAACISAEVQRIYNPTHEVQYDPPYAPNTTINAARLLLIGDVHGMRNELEELLEAAGYSLERGDRVIFAGDLVNKGPDSAGVVRLAMDLNAASVRGNHEDVVLRTWAGAEVAKALAKANGLDPQKAVVEYESTLSAENLQALKTARSLTAEQRRWAAERPLSLRLGQLPGFGEVVVVHAGLAPGLELQHQEPWAMYNVRSLLYPDDNGDFATDRKKNAFSADILARLHDMKPGREPSEDRIEEVKKETLECYNATDVPAVPISTNEGRWWVESWNEVEKAKPEGERLTLVYGHDSKRGLQIYDYSKGLDTRCVNGVKLTAMVLEPVDNGAGKGITLSHRFVDVPCPNGDTSS